MKMKYIVSLLMSVMVLTSCDKWLDVKSDLDIYETDLFEEAIALGSKAVSLVDTTDFSPEEEARLADAQADAAKKDDATSPDPSGVAAASGN